MIRVGWLADAPTYVGGAELTQAEFRAAVPDGVQIIECPPGAVKDCDRYAIHNCMSYELADLEAIGPKPAVKYHNDVGPWLTGEMRRWLDEHTLAICCSPLQADYMGLGDAKLIPPPVPLDRFEQAAMSVNGDRAGAVCVGSWRNHGKAAHRAAAWAAENRLSIDFYGDGPFAPQSSRPVAYEEMPALLARYQTFVFLPQVIEPFGRIVAEAHAAGCELVINDLIGAKYWLTERPEALQSAAADFWKLVLR